MTSVHDIFGNQIRDWWREGEYLRAALDHFDNLFGFPDKRCPIIEDWRKRYIDKVNWYLPLPDKSRPKPSKVHSEDEIAHRFESSAHVSLPRRRRPTLTKTENKRTQFTDRYYFGVYDVDF